MFLTRREYEWKLWRTKRVNIYHCGIKRLLISTHFPVSVVGRWYRIFILYNGTTAQGRKDLKSSVLGDGSWWLPFTGWCVIEGKMLNHSCDLIKPKFIDTFSCQCFSPRYGMILPDLHFKQRLEGGRQAGRRHWTQSTSASTHGCWYAVQQWSFSPKCICLIAF